MVRAGAFELHLCVGCIKQLELVNGAGVAYVESKFAVSGVSYKVQSRETDPWGEEFTQARNVAACKLARALRLLVAPCAEAQRNGTASPASGVARHAVHAEDHQPLC